MERVATMANLKRAWERVRANKGSCGVDGESVAAYGEVIGEVNRFAAGWLEYFRLAAAKKWLAETEGWLRRRLRCYRLKQCKRRIGVARFLMERGCREDHAWMLAMRRKGWYRKSASPQATKAMDSGWFRLQGLRPLALPSV